MGKGRKEGNVLSNDALNTFYLGLYVVRHMVKDHTDSERGNPLPPHGLRFPISSKGSFICIRITHTTAFVTPVLEHWLKREIRLWLELEWYIYIYGSTIRNQSDEYQRQWYVQQSLLLIGNSRPCGVSGFPLSLSRWFIIVCSTLYNRK